MKENKKRETEREGKRKGEGERYPVHINYIPDSCDNDQ